MDAAIYLISKFEGCRLQAYQDVGGKWTIGYGHLITDQENHLMSDSITQAQADEILEHDILTRANLLDIELPHPILYSTPHYFAPLTSLMFNIGKKAFANSTVVKLLRKEHFYTAIIANAMCMWNKVNGEICSGLIKRRMAEAMIFMPTVLEVANNAEKQIHTALDKTFAPFEVVRPPLAVIDDIWGLLSDPSKINAIHTATNFLQAYPRINEN